MNTNITFNKSIIFLFSNPNVPHVLDLMLFVLFICFIIDKIGFIIKIQ